jgi:two-component system sensor histidine kinase FlrB
MQQAQDYRSRERQVALESLERVSRELDASYRDLESRVARLNEELAAARSGRLRELAEKERLLERLASLMALLPGGVLLLDAERRVRDANPAAVDLLGEPLMGCDWAGIEARIGQSRERHLSVLTRHLEPDDEMVVLITDTTEIHELQAQVGREQRLSALGEMAARLAHQIRTPLSSTTLYLAQLRRAQLPAPQRERICDRLSDRLAHMEGLIDSMLGFLRGSSPVQDTLHVQDVLTDLEAVVSGPLREAGAQLRMTRVDRSLCLRGSRSELVGALGNLVMNAIENGGEAVSIAIWAGATAPNSLQITVSDDGPGIAENIRERIFDPFFTTRAAGTGLGLAVVARVVAEHSGRLEVGDAPGGGAIFTLEFPMLTAGENDDAG